MKIRVLTLCPDPETGILDESPLLALQEDVEVLQVSEYLYSHQGETRLALVVRLRPPVAPATPRRVPTDPVADLPQVDRALYQALRRWRNERAKRDGRPAYVLFNNAQLADIARARPRSLAALTQIHGVGEGRARDLGAEVLAIVEQTPQGAEPGADDEQP